MAFSGEYRADFYSNSGCSASNGGWFTDTYSGSATFDLDAGVLVSMGSATFLANSSGPVVRSLSGDEGWVNDSPCNRTVTRTQTVGRREGTGACCSSLSDWVRATGAMVWELSEPDSEAAAIGRLLAGAGGVWGGWTVVGSGLGQCAASSCCRASWEARGAGQFSFAYQESEYRVTSAGNTPGFSVTLRVRFFRKPTGAPDTAYVYAAEDQHVVTPDSEGVAQASGTVPITQGYDTYVASCVRVNPT